MIRIFRIQKNKKKKLIATDSLLFYFRIYILNAFIVDHALYLLDFYLNHFEYSKNN